jgi:uncharacterized protein
MRFASVAFLVGVLLLAAFAPPVLAADFGTREEAVAMVKRVQSRIRRDGLEATCRAITIGAKEFADRDLFPFIISFQGVVCASAQTPTVAGKNILDLKDQDGKFLYHEQIALAKNPGYGWVDYRWPQATTKVVEDKSTYVERVEGIDYLIGVGIYKNEQPNVNAIGVISGSPNSDDTYLQMAYDLAEVLNDGENMRILPFAGIGGTRNIRDVRYVKGIDIGLTQSSVLNSFRRSGELMGQADSKIVYIAKLFNEEVHVITHTNITAIEQLRGLRVNLDAKGSGTSFTMRGVFKALGIDIEEVSMSQTEALEKVKSGEIAATVLIAGKPVRSMSRLTPADGLHFVPIPFSRALISDYLPSALGHDDYPEMIPLGDTVETIAVGAVMITYNWPRNASERYQRIERFVDAFFSKIDEFRKPPRHPKWREVNIGAALPGWTRFEPAQNWIDSRRNAQEQSNPRQTVTAGNAAGRQPPPEAAPPEPDAAQRSGLYQEFLRWRQERQSPGQVPPASSR